MRHAAQTDPRSEQTAQPSRKAAPVVGAVATNEYSVGHRIRGERDVDSNCESFMIHETQQLDKKNRAWIVATGNFAALYEHCSIMI